MNLILFGFKGCGKTFYGKRFAEKTHRPFVDTDDQLMNLYVQETGESLSVREIYRKYSEEGFRFLEKRAIEQLANLSNTIISLGGGAILDPENQEVLGKIGELVYLQAGIQTLRKRTFEKELPAYLQDESAFDTMYKARLLIYESIPAHRINVDLLDEPAVITALQSILIFSDT